jgi:hypothetical protein
MASDEAYDMEDFGDENAEDLGGVDEEAAADFLQAADAGDIAVLQQMSDRTELLEAQDEMGNTALHLAALNAHVRCPIKEHLDRSAPYCFLKCKRMRIYRVLILTWTRTASSFHFHGPFAPQPPTPPPPTPPPLLAQLRGAAAGAGPRRQRRQRRGQHPPHTRHHLPRPDRRRVRRGPHPPQVWRRGSTRARARWGTRGHAALLSPAESL